MAFSDIARDITCSLVGGKGCLEENELFRIGKAVHCSFQSVIEVGRAARADDVSN